jgi:hypothetical protein
MLENNLSNDIEKVSTNVETIAKVQKTRDIKVATDVNDKFARLSSQVSGAESAIAQIN